MRMLVWLAVVTGLVVVWIGYARLTPPAPGRGNEQTTEAGRDVEGRAFPEELTDEAIARLNAWLRADGSASPRVPRRNIFEKAAQPAAVPVTAAPASSETETVVVNRPRLSGFVFKGGQVDRPLAAIRFEDRMWLVGVGELVGPFRVEAMVVGEEVHLIHQETGESLRLTIE